MVLILMSKEALRETEIQPRQENFNNFIEKRQKSANTLLCVGLDLDIDHPQFPKDLIRPYGDVGLTLRDVGKTIIDATHDLVCAYKPNIAFYEQYGTAGMNALEETIEYIREKDPEIAVIGDMKRADIGNTNLGYAKAAYDYLGVDAVTVNPYFGGEALLPFLNRKDKGVVILCRTSNQGAKDIQDDKVYLKNLSEEAFKFFANLEGVVEGIDHNSNLAQIYERAYIREYQKVAYMAAFEWNKNNNITLVVGATYPEEMKKVRKIVGDEMLLLIPGLGAQGGKVEDISKGYNTKIGGEIANISRAVIFPKLQENETYAQAVRREAMKWRNEINVSRREIRIKQIFNKTKAIIANSHIVYTNGEHGSSYINKDAIYPHSEEIWELCGMFAEDFKDKEIDVVAGPAVGGVILESLTAQHLTKITGRTIHGVYAEKQPDGSFVFGRGYSAFIVGKNILVTEDVLTTGGSAAEVIKAINKLGGKIIGLAVLADRREDKTKDIEGIKVNALAKIDMEKYKSDSCILCETGVDINTQVGKGKEFLAKKQTSGAQ